MEHDDTFAAVFLVVFANVGSWMLANANPVIGTISLSLSTLYVFLKLRREWEEFWSQRKKDPKDPPEH